MFPGLRSPFLAAIEVAEKVPDLIDCVAYTSSDSFQACIFPVDSLPLLVCHGILTEVLYLDLKLVSKLRLWPGDGMWAMVSCSCQENLFPDVVEAVPHVSVVDVVLSCFTSIIDNLRDFHDHVISLGSALHDLERWRVGNSSSSAESVHTLFGSLNDVHLPGDWNSPSNRAVCSTQVLDESTEVASRTGGSASLALHPFVVPAKIGGLIPGFALPAE